MLPYSILMFAVTAVFIVLGILIYKGNTNLIYSYHQTNVKDKTAYGKAFDKALFVFAIAPFASGVVGLLGESKAVAITAVVVLIAGIIVGFGGLFAVQKKYNKGLF